MLDRLILVEPDRDLAEWLDSSLRDAGYEIQTVADCKAAVAALQVDQPLPDVIVLDVNDAEAHALRSFLAAHPRFRRIEVVIDRYVRWPLPARRAA